METTAPDAPTVSKARPPARPPLDAIFTPRSVAVIGATDRPGSVGRTVFWNLISSPFGGAVYAVHPTRHNVLGVRAYPSIGAIGDKVDLAVIVTPAETVPDLLRECGDAGVKGAIIISAGFKEVGEKGKALEARVVEVAREAGIRVVGPNCLGVMAPNTGLNATFASTVAKPGQVAFISQSGALCTGILDWSHRNNVGFSAFVSIGSMADVSWGDLIYYLGDDPRTKAIVIYMESIGDAQGFLSAAREVALTKPVIVLKAGRTSAAAQAAASHTGTLAGSDNVLDAAFRRTGVLRVNEIEDLFNMAEVLGKQPRPRGPRLSIVTNAGGPGVLATDALIGAGCELATLNEATIDRLSAVCPPAWSHGNPIDVLGDADPERYGKALEIVLGDEANDGTLVILTPQAMTDPTAIAERLKNSERPPNKPVLASWMGGADVAAGEAILNQCGIPTFPYPDQGAKVFSYMWRYAYNLTGIYQTPELDEEFEAAPDRERVAQILATARQKGIETLSEFDSKAVLRAYNIPVVETRAAHTEEEAVTAADRIGYPVVVKLWSETVTHKSDVGGVQLNLQDASAVAAAFRGIRDRVAELKGEGHFGGVTVQPMVKLDGYELILGSSIDTQFGPVLLFGTGGTLVEVFRDSALELPPLNSTLARRMMEQTRIYEALHGVRGKPPVDLHRLEQILVRFSQLVAEQPWIREIDINPFLASHTQLIALDGRVVLHPADTPEDQLPRPAIRPYPSQYADSWKTEDGKAVVDIRPMRPEDEPKIRAFHEALSEDTVYFRYMGVMSLRQRVSHERLMKLCFIDYARAMALVAEGPDPETGEERLMGIARYTRDRATGDAEFALVVADPFQGMGLGRELLRRLIEVGRAEGLRRLYGGILPENRKMEKLCRNLGFDIHKETGEPLVAEYFYEDVGGAS